MARIVSLRPWHLRLIDPQAEQVIHAAPQLNEDFGEAVIAAGPAWACVDGERVYGAGGFVFEDWRAVAWAILGQCAGRQMMAMTRVARREVARITLPIEAYVRDEFAAGERWAKLLGLSLQSSGVGPNGLMYGKWVRNVDAS